MFCQVITQFMTLHLLFKRLWVPSLNLTSTCLILFISPNSMAQIMTLGLLAWSLLFNHNFYGYISLVKKICLQLSNLLSLCLIKHQWNIRARKKTESSTKPGYKWIALLWGYWMVLLIPLSRIMLQICLLQRRSGILFIRSMLKTDKALMFIHLWRRSGAWIGMVLFLCLTTLEGWLIFVVGLLKERVPWMIWCSPMLFFAHFLTTMLSEIFLRCLLLKKGQALLYLKQWWAWMAFMII